jgi:uncharacterized phage-associated protein
VIAILKTDQSMEKSLTIANYFIKKAMQTGAELTPMKLIKLVYIANGWYLALKKEPLIDENVEAWKFGPVVPTVYYQFRKFYKGQIDSYYTDSLTGTTPMPVDAALIQFLDRIWQVYGKYNGMQLSALTHQQGTPWFEVWHHQGGNIRNSVVIGSEIIREHYLQKMTTNQTVANA